MHTPSKETKLGRILKIAVPIVISQASYTVLLFINRLFLSRISKYELAAALSGGLTSFVLSSFFEGLVGYVTALVAQYYGAGRSKMCTRATTQALFIAFISYPVLLAFIPLVKYIFITTSQDPTLANLATIYAQMLLAGSIFVLLRIAIGGFFIGIGKTGIVMAANVSSLFISLPLNYVFIFGKLGLPALGIRGAALGTICGSLFALLVLLAFYIRETVQGPYKVSSPLRFMPDIMTRLLRYGFPAGMEPFLNWFAFNIFLQIMHSYGPNTAAAATIAFNWDTIAFVPMLGLGIAATSVIGQHLGAQDYDGAQESVYLTMRAAILYSIVMIVLFVGFAEPLVALFASGFVVAGEGISEMAVSMLRLLALYTVANSCKLVLNGSLRAAGDTVWVMWVAIALHWAMAVSTVVLVRVFNVPQLTAWSTLIIMNNTHAAAVFYRFRSNKWRKLALIH